MKKISFRRYIVKYRRILKRLQWRRIFCVLAFVLLIFIGISCLKNKAKANTSLQIETVSSSAEAITSENDSKNFECNYIVVYDTVNLRIEPDTTTDNTIISKLLKNQKVILKQTFPHRYDKEQREWVYVIVDPETNYGGWVIAESISKI